MQANLLYEVRFRRWLMRKVTTEGSYDRTTAIAEGAEVVGCSPATTARYLAKLTSASGPLIETKDALGYSILVLKTHLQNHPHVILSEAKNPSNVLSRFIILTASLIAAQSRYHQCSRYIQGCAC